MGQAFNRLLERLTAHLNNAMTGHKIFFKEITKYSAIKCAISANIKKNDSTFVKPQALKVANI